MACFRDIPVIRLHIAYPWIQSLISEYAEAVPDGDTCRALGEVAKSSQTFLIGGSIPERDGDNLYNTLTVWNPQGELIQTHRKMHLFDIDIPGKITFKGEKKYREIYSKLLRFKGLQECRCNLSCRI